jgi:hypothetical protein
MSFRTLMTNVFRCFLNNKFHRIETKMIHGNPFHTECVSKEIDNLVSVL